MRVSHWSPDRRVLCFAHVCKSFHRPLDLDKTSKHVGVLVSREGSARKAQRFRVTLSFFLLSAYQAPSLYAVGHEELLRAVGGVVDQTRRHRSDRRFRLRVRSSCLNDLPLPGRAIEHQKHTLEHVGSSADERET